MFRPTYFHHQEDWIVHAALYGVLFRHLCKQSLRLKDVLDIRLLVQYSLPYDEHKIFETCRRREELNYNINLKSTFGWLTLHNYLTLCSVGWQCYWRVTNWTEFGRQPHCLEEVLITKTNISQESVCSRRDSKRVPPECVSRSLPTHSPVL